MQLHGQRIRRVMSISILSAAAFAGALLMTATSASAATPLWALNGFNAAGAGPVQRGQAVTFVFTATNQSTRTAERYLVITKVAHVTVTGWTCLSASGADISLDGNFCEPGRAKPGQQLALVMTGTATGAVGTAASARVCLDNPSSSTLVFSQCKTVSAKIVAAST